MRSPSWPALYLAISSAGIPAMLAVIAATGLFRGLQDTRTPLVIAVAGFAANAALNALLIYGAGWGIAGSAIGTVLAQWGMAIACIAIAIRHARREQASIRPGLPGVASAARSGGWMLLRTVTLRVALVATTVAATGLGTVTLASTQVLFQLTFLFALALDAFAIAAQAMIGFDLGAAPTRRCARPCVGCCCGASDRGSCSARSSRSLRRGSARCSRRMRG